MFEPISRYYNLEQKIHISSEGKELAYIARRIVPKVESLTMLSEVIVEQSDRLDLIAARVLGNPLMFWQICDANTAINPFELVEEPNRKLKIAMPHL